MNLQSGIAIGNVFSLLLVFHAMWNKMNSHGTVKKRDISQGGITHVRQELDNKLKELLTDATVAGTPCTINQVPKESLQNVREITFDCSNIDEIKLSMSLGGAGSTASFLGVYRNAVTFVLKVRANNKVSLCEF